MVDYTYKINLEKKIVVCIMTVHSEVEKYQVSAVARCAPNDVFSLDKGKAISKRKALIKWKQKWLEAEKEEVYELEDYISRLTQELYARIRKCDKMRKTISRLRKEITEVDAK